MSWYSYLPTVVDRFIQQAIAQIISAEWEPHFHPSSYGFRPERSAHQAVRQVQADIRAGYAWVVDTDREAFFEKFGFAHEGIRRRGSVVGNESHDVYAMALLRVEGA